MSEYPTQTQEIGKRLEHVIQSKYLQSHELLILNRLSIDLQRLPELVPVDKARGRYLLIGGDRLDSFASTLDKVLHGERSAMLLIDETMNPNEYPWATLTGQPPGFDGPPGLLTNFLLENPDGLVILDDALSLPEEVIQLIARACDQGFLHDGLLNKVSTTNAFFLVRAEIGQDALRTIDGAGIETAAQLHKQTSRALSQAYSEHLSSWVRGRFSSVIEQHLWQSFRLGGMANLLATLPTTACIPDPQKWKPILRVSEPTQGTLQIAPVPVDFEEQDVFISYRSSKHADIALRLSKECTAIGLRCWFDLQQLKRKGEERFDRAALASSLLAAVRRSRCSVVFELGLRAVILPPELSWKEAIDQKLVMATEVGLVEWNWQRLEMEESDRFLSINYEGRELRAYGGYPDRELFWVKSFGNDDELAELVKDYASVNSQEPRRPPIPHRSTTSRHLASFLGECPSEAQALIREIISYGTEHPATPNVIKALGSFDGPEDTVRLAIGLMQDQEAAWRRFDEYNYALESLYYKTRPFEELRELVVSLATRSIAESNPEAKTPLWILAFHLHEDMDPRLSEAFLASANDVKIILNWIMQLGNFSDSSYRSHFQNFWKAGMRLNAREFEQGLHAISVRFTHFLTTHPLSPKSLSQLVADIQPRPTGPILQMFNQTDLE